VQGFYEASYHEQMTGGNDSPERRRAYQKENEIRVADLRRHVSRGRVLDIGCSRGDFAQALSVSGFEAYGLDISPDACAAARSLLGEGRVFCEPVEQLAPRMTGQFAAVTLMDVIEHCCDVVSFLTAIHRLLQPGGILFLRTPTLRSPFHFLGSLSFRLSLGRYKKALFKLYHAEHLYFFNEPSMRRLLDDCGFETLEVVPDPLCWDNFRTAELRQGALGNLLLAATYFAGRALDRGHGMKVIARRKADPIQREAASCA
jgi:2-polyprenyl-3-methyl-5-hydroxy-6-metoxy-1,4-benzoquinol methylase